MTKTFSTVVSHRFSNAGLPVIMSLEQLITDESYGILNLGHWDLFGIWFLVLGILLIHYLRSINQNLVLFSPAMRLFSGAAISPDAL